jgi:Putative stress-responsive transcriptional regulator
MTGLYRSEDNQILGGVCAGIAERYDQDPAVVRLVTALLFLSGVTPVLYIVAWIVVPRESEVKS